MLPFWRVERVAIPVRGSGKYSGPIFLLILVEAQERHTTGCHTISYNFDLESFLIVRQLQEDINLLVPGISSLLSHLVLFFDGGTRGW
jgi:hypothetical protein